MKETPKFTIARKQLFNAYDAAADLQMTLRPMNLYLRRDTAGMETTIQEMYITRQKFDDERLLLWDTVLRPLLAQTKTSDMNTFMEMVIRHQKRYMRFFAKHCPDIKEDVAEKLTGDIALMRAQCAEALKEMRAVQEILESQDLSDTD